MTEATWNKHKATIIEMDDDEGTFSLPGKTVLLKRGNYGLLCSWVHSCFEVLPVEIKPDGTLVKIEENHPDFIGGMDIWSQGYGLFSWREGWSKSNVHIPERKELGEYENVIDARRPKLVVFIPPDRLKTKTSEIYDVESKQIL